MVSVFFSSSVSVACGKAGLGFLMWLYNWRGLLQVNLFMFLLAGRLIQGRWLSSFQPFLTAASISSSSSWCFIPSWRLLGRSLLSWKLRKMNWGFLVVPGLSLCHSFSLWWSRAAAVSRTQLEVQLGPHLAVFGLEAQIGLASRAPNTSKCIAEP
jgi:hypothetical protein